MPRHQAEVWLLAVEGDTVARVRWTIGYTWLEGTTDGVESLLVLIRVDEHFESPYCLCKFLCRQITFRPESNDERWAFECDMDVNCLLVAPVRLNPSDR